MKRGGQRSVNQVPRPVLALFAAALVSQIGWQTSLPRPVARADALDPPPSLTVLRTVSLGETIALAQGLALYLQAFDNQPGISIPFKDLDYPRVLAWLETILALDPATEYPLMMASQLYAQVPDESHQRLMFDFVHRKFLQDPDRRWRWLAHCALLAKHRLHDPALALAYAEDIARYAHTAPGWARQMRIFILEDMGELESATVLLGGLLASGEITDPREIHFLTERLEKLKNAEKSTSSSKN
ncbi:MAG: hypothetical protein ACK4N4_10925 [Burkholderiales bacterium]